MKRVAHFIYNYLPLSETFIYNDITHLEKYQPVVFSVKTHDIDKFPFNPLYSIDSMRFPADIMQFLTFKAFDWSPYILKKMKQSGVSLVHAHFGHIGAKLLKIKRRIKVPLLVGFYGADIPILRNSGKYTDLFRESDGLIALSDDMKNDLLEMGCPKEKIFVSDVGMDISQFDYMPRTIKDEIRIMTAARLVEKKGISYLVEAFAKVKRSYPKACLTVVGDGPLRKDIASLAKNLDVEINITGMVPYETYKKILYRSHLFVLPSVMDRSGGKDEFSTVLKESMASGMPVVSTRHAGIPDVIIDGKDGVLVDEKDSEMLAKKMISLIEKGDWRSLCENGRKLIEEKYSMDRRIEDLENMYGSLLN